MPASSDSGESALRVADGQFLIVLYLQLVESREKKQVPQDSYKDTNPIHKGSTLMTSASPNYFPKAPPPQTIILGRGF